MVDVGSGDPGFNRMKSLVFESLRGALQERQNGFLVALQMHAPAASQKGTERHRKKTRSKALRGLGIAQQEPQKNR